MYVEGVHVCRVWVCRGCPCVEGVCIIFEMFLSLLLVSPLTLET